jgi:integrin beta 3
MPKQRDTTALVKAVATVVREQIAKAVQSLSTRLEAFERRFAELPVPRDGRDGIDGKDGSPGASGERGLDGKDGAPGERGAIGEKGDPGDVGPQGLPGAPGERGIDGTSGKDGRDGGPGPTGEKGERGELGPQGEPGPAGIPGGRGADGVAGKDGTDGACGPIGERGERGEAGPQGERGAPGTDGKSVTLADVTPIVEGAIAKGMLDLERRGMDLIQRCIDRIEKPKDGTPGKDGRDAFSLDDFHSELAEDGRTLTLAWVAGENRIERKHVLPHVIYRGVHQQGKQYQRGDSVTFQGSTWIAMRDTCSKPETDDSWRLATKRGRDGKDGKNGERGERGAPGRSEQRA